MHELRSGVNMSLLHHRRCVSDRGVCRMHVKECCSESGFLSSNKCDHLQQKTYISKPSLPNQPFLQPAKAQNVHLKALAFASEPTILATPNSSKHTSQSSCFRTMIRATNKSSTRTPQSFCLRNNRSCNRRRLKTNVSNFLLSNIILATTRSSKRTSQSLCFRINRSCNHLLSNQTVLQPPAVQNVHLKALACKPTVLSTTNSSKRTCQSICFRVNQSCKQQKLNMRISTHYKALAF